MQVREETTPVVMTIDKARTFITRLLMFGVPLFALYNMDHPWSPLRENSFFVILILAIVFINPKRHPGSPLWLVFDSANLLIAVGVFGWVFLQWQTYLIRLGAPTTTDIVLGALAVYVTLVATLRELGKPLFVVVLLFLLYVFFGQHLPHYLGGHSGYSLNRIFSFVFLGAEGMLGYILGIMLKYMVLFLLLGKVLQFTGALDFIMDLARVIFRKGTSGPPLMAVLSSGMVGSIIGSGTANVYVTGNVTIPLMKRVGVKPELAGGIEAAASTGSQIMPPVMGFTAFFMMALLGVAYFEIVVAAFVPAVLFFLAVGVAVFIRTRNIKVTSGETWQTTLRWRDVIFRVSTVTFLGTLTILVTLLSLRYSLQLSALYAMAFAFGSSLLGRDRVIP
ncbi:MAG: TRAP transporter large permease subunit, partial [Dehalococcoidia bacterium]